MSTQYKAFLLRLRREEGQSHWRVTMENAYTGELIRFANQNEMLRYLLQKLAEPSNPREQINSDRQYKGDDQADST
jgi:hypothetical protein